MTNKSAATVEETAVVSFYDDFNPRLIRDYVNGNPRVEIAIDLVIRSAPADTKKVLDIGCGMGYSSARFSEAFPSASILGVDISPRNIEVADKLFGCERIRFLTANMQSVPQGGPFDLIALLDVYEHVPRNAWSIFNEVLAESLASEGRIVLTTPSHLHQEYLRVHQPSGLQVIDETVTLEDILQLSRDTSAFVTHYAYVPVWTSHQYVHVVLDRDPAYQSVKTPPMTNKWTLPGIVDRIRSRQQLRIRKLEFDRRRELVRSRLGISPD